jgi:hypothetical protein
MNSSISKLFLKFDQANFNRLLVNFQTVITFLLFMVTVDNLLN